MPKVAQKFRGISVTNIPRTTEEQLRFLIEERRYTKTGAFVRAIDLLFREEYARMVEEHEEAFDESAQSQ